jgi:uncharacterized protein YjcR
LANQLKIAELEARLNATVVATNAIGETVLDKKEIAKSMQLKGVKQIDIAEHFNVNRKTISRWLKSSS